jgi:hypothetical protein
MGIRIGALMRIKHEKLVPATIRLFYYLALMGDKWLENSKDQSAKDIADIVEIDFCITHPKKYNEIPNMTAKQMLQIEVADFITRHTAPKPEDEWLR